MNDATEKPAPMIVLFDGTCGLCDATVNFITQRDQGGRFQFAPQQSQFARDLMLKHQLDPDKIDAVVLIDGDRAYTKSTAALRISLELKEPWPLLGILVFIPAWLRDDVYDFVARHRHQWFAPPGGACRIS